MNEQLYNNTCQEDEIDLRELFQTIAQRKWFIIIFTCIVTFGAIVFAYMKTPIYEAKALVEIGSYKIENSNSNSNIMLDDAAQLSRRLNAIFIDPFKNKKDRNTTVSSISVPKGAKNFIEIKVESVSNELAIEELKKVINYIQTKHKKILEGIKTNREVEITNITSQIKTIKTKELGFLDEELSLTKKNLANCQSDLKEINNNIKLQKKSNPTLTALSLMEKRNLNTQISKFGKDIVLLQVKKNKLLTIKVSELIEKKNRLKLMLQPYNYKNSEIVGKIITNDYPIKPKKKLIVVLAFVTGLILSIFLVFFLQFIRVREEE